MRPKFSVVSPVYRAEQMVDLLVDRIKTVLEQITDNYEIILVEDCGPDNSWQKIVENAQKDERIKGIKLSRNYGQHYAITAGLDHSRGDWVIVMDCDLQDRPEEIPRLFAKAQEGYDVVLAKRYQRKDGYFKKLFSKVFYSVLSYLTGASIDHTVANFGIYSRKAIDAICKMRESIRYFPTMVRWVGYKSSSIEVKHAERAAGSTTYNIRKLFRLALDIMLNYSDKPLRITVQLGMAISIVSFIAAIIMVIRAVQGKIHVLGYASLIVSVWFLSGLIMLTLGVMGLYLGKTFEGVKRRPIYLISEKMNVDREKDLFVYND